MYMLLQIFAKRHQSSHKMVEFILRKKTNAANIGFEGLLHFCETNFLDTTNKRGHSLSVIFSFAEN